MTALCSTGLFQHFILYPLYSNIIVGEKTNVELVICKYSPFPFQSCNSTPEMISSTKSGHSDSHCISNRMSSQCVAHKSTVYMHTCQHVCTDHKRGSHKAGVASRAGFFSCKVWSTDTEGFCENVSCLAI